MASRIVIRAARSSAGTASLGRLDVLCSKSLAPTAATILSSITPTASPVSVRFQSTVSADAATSTTGGACPFTGKSSSKNAPNDPEHPSLQKVPTLPFFGSLLRAHSGIPPLDDPYNFWPTMRKTYGDFYSFGFPGLGDPDDSHHTVYVTQCPHEMAKVIRSEGAYPSGFVQGSWALKKWEKDAGFETASHEDGGFFGNGENWKRLRQFMQTDLLHPEAARGYRSIIIEAAKLASRGAPASSEDMEHGGINAFLERCAFDMFSAVMFGDLMNCADPTTPTNAEDQEFVLNAKEGLRRGVTVARSLKEQILVGKLGIETPDYKEMKHCLDIAWKIGGDKIERFIENRARGELTETERHSYLYRALERYESGGSNVSLKEAKEMSWGGIFAAVDTTSGKMAWNVLHAALNPKVQQKVYEQLMESTKKCGKEGELTVESLDKNNAPYLHQFIREAHRITPVSPLATRKRVASPHNSSSGEDGLDIHGIKLPIGSAVLCDGYSLGQDSEYVDNPRQFIPERWSDEAVKERKGTKREVIDHPFFKDPFSQGARKCPGSRVALNEVAVLLAQLVLDYNISAPEGLTLEDVEHRQETVVEPILPRLFFEPRS